jgi:hypothetical protein
LVVLNEKKKCFPRHSEFLILATFPSSSQAPGELSREEFTKKKYPRKKCPEKKCLGKKFSREKWLGEEMGQEKYGSGKK